MTLCDSGAIFVVITGSQMKKRSAESKTGAQAKHNAERF
jgi:hypothetical protein